MRLGKPDGYASCRQSPAATNPSNFKSVRRTCELHGGWANGSNAEVIMFGLGAQEIVIIGLIGLFMLFVLMWLMRNVTAKK